MSEKIIFLFRNLKKKKLSQSTKIVFLFELSNYGMFKIKILFQLIN